MKFKKIIDKTKNLNQLNVIRKIKLQHEFLKFLLESKKIFLITLSHIGNASNSYI